jgi:PEP-CTERM motif
MRFTKVPPYAHRMSFFTSVLSAMTVSFFAGNATASSIASWTFETNPPVLSNSTDFGPLAADNGIGTASGHHASAATDWSSPVGNGSLHAWSSTHWGAGDYYQFQVSSIALQNVVIDWDQTGSGTSPAAFALQWSTDGTTFNPFALYTVLLTVSPNPAWSSSTAHPQYHFHDDLSSVTNLNNQPAIYLRLTAQAAASSVLGTDRVDNVNISGVPEPSSFILAALGLIGLVAWRRRKR